MSEAEVMVAVTAHQPGITEIQAGGAMFDDVAGRAWEVGMEPALFVRATATSRPAPGRAVVDAGFKALPLWHVAPEPLGLAGGATLVTPAGHGTLCLERPDEGLRVGDVLDF